MPYFLILPVFFLAMLTLSAAAIACAVVPQLRWMLPYAWRVLVWSGVGCILANVPVFALYFLPFALEHAGTWTESGAAQGTFKVVLVVGLLLGPVIASVVGFLGGAALGVWRAFKLTKKASPSIETTA